MSDPMIDAINQPSGKSWSRSKTIWGLIGAAVFIWAPKYQPIADILPPLAGQLGATASLLWGLYGRLKTDTRVNSPIAPK